MQKNGKLMNQLYWIMDHPGQQWFAYIAPSVNSVGCQLRILPCILFCLYINLGVILLFSEQQKTPEPAVLDHEPSKTTMVCTQSTQCEQRRLSIEDFINDPEGIHHYTGMKSYSKFMLLFYCFWDHLLSPSPTITELYRLCPLVTSY